jgi:hypothetical protein
MTNKALNGYVSAAGRSHGVDCPHAGEVLATSVETP